LLDEKQHLQIRRILFERLFVFVNLQHARLGSIGMPAYMRLYEDFMETVIGVDYNQEKMNELKSDKYNAVWGNTTDRDFWEESTVLLFFLSSPDGQMDRNVNIEKN